MGLEDRRDYNYYSDHVGQIRDADDGGLLAAAIEGQELYDIKKTELTGKVSDVSNEKFAYSPMTDELYLQYAQQYMQNGQKAAKNAIAESSLMTGGYGNSWAATAGAQAYGEWMDKLNGVIPELQNAAYDKWSADKSDRLYDAQDRLNEYVGEAEPEVSEAWAEVDEWNNRRLGEVLNLLSEGYINGELTRDDLYSLLGQYDDSYNQNDLDSFVDVIEDNKLNYDIDVNNNTKAAYNARAAIIKEITDDPSLANALYVTDRMLAEGLDIGDTGESGLPSQVKAILDHVPTNEVNNDGDNISEAQYAEAQWRYENYGKDALLDYLEMLTAMGVNTVGLEDSIPKQYKDGELVDRPVIGTGSGMIDAIREIQGRNYTMTDDGGKYIGKINDNAQYTYKDDTGKEITVTAEDIYKELVNAGLSKKAAKQWINDNLEGH